MPEIVLKPIGRVVSSRRNPADDNWDQVESRLELDPEVITPEALAGLEGFSHLEVVFYMHRVDPAKIQTGSRHPRNNPAWPKVGILAQRAKNRVNQIGVTVCRLGRVEGLSVEVFGLDAIDGSPILDLKPFVREYGPRGPVRQPDWTTELMKNYWS